MHIFDCDQGSPEWFRCRMGIVTASRFATVMADGRAGAPSKTRAEYMRKLAGEILTGEPMDTYVSADMERGKVQENEARSLYAFMFDAEPQRVGFVRNGDMGCSPDSLLEDDGGLEIKTANPHIQIERLLRGDLPPEHKAQVQGNLLVTGRTYWEFVSYCPKLPLLRVRVEREPLYLDKLRAEIETFNAELNVMVDRIRCLDAQPVNLLAAG